MPSISKIRFTNLVYENGAKRYLDTTFAFDGENGIILLENGGGKTVFVQAVLQAVLPHAPLADRRVRDTFSLENGPAHIAIEWILSDRPRTYALTAVTLFISKDSLDSYRYVYRYGPGDPHAIENLPFVKETSDGRSRPASREEILEYYREMARASVAARLFDSITEYQNYLEEHFKIIPSEWQKIAVINSAEGNVEGFFAGCRTTSQLVDNLLIPAVEKVMAGNGPQDFVDIFDRQREHFKKHRQLREQIEESRQVEVEIRRYVAVFTEYHETGQQLMAAKQELKAIHQLLSEARDATEAQIAANEAGKLELEVAVNEWDRKLSSFHLAVQREKRDRARKELERLSQTHESLQINYDALASRLQNLEIARLKAAVEDCRLRIDDLNEQLASLDADPDIQELQRRYELNSAGLRYCFLEEESEISRRMENYQQQVEGCDEQIRKLDRELQEYRRRYETLLGKKAHLESAIETGDNDMREIVRHLLANPLTDDIEQEHAKWKARINELEKLKNDNLQEIRRLEEACQKAAQEIPDLRKELERTNNQVSSLQHRIGQIQARQEQILEQLRSRFARGYAWDSLYLKEQLITEQLTAAAERLRRQKEELLLKERQALRIVDLYQQSSFYMADPQLEKWAEDWQGQFSYLMAGTLYVQQAAESLGKDLSWLFERFPFWAVVLICREDEADRLQAKLADQANRMSHPVIVLSREEAARICQGVAETWFDPFKRRVFPAAWKDNLSNEAFRAWKQAVETIGLKTVEERRAREHELQEIEYLLNSVREFLTANPYEDYRHCEMELKEAELKSFELRGAVEEKEKQREVWGQELLNCHRSLTDIEQEYADLSYRMQQASTYFRKKAEREQAVRDLTACEKLLELARADCSRIEEERDRVVERRNQMRRELSLTEEELLRLRREPLFREVEGLAPVDSGKPRSFLEFERKRLSDELQQKQAGRGELNSRINMARQQLDEMQKELGRRRQQCTYPVDEAMRCPPDVDQIMDRIILQLNELKPQLDSLEIEVRAAEELFHREDAALQKDRENFLKRFEEEAVFEEPLPQVEVMLQRERDELETRRRLLKEMREKLDKEKNEIGGLIGKLELKNERYGFLAETIKAAPLPPSFMQDFPYRRTEMVEARLLEIEELQERTAAKRDEVERCGRQVEQFCHNHVREPRLKQMVITGILGRKTYEELLEWQSLMNDRIASIIRVAEDDIRELDSELQQFINHLHIHLVTLARELRMIPRKTRVKIAESWKEVFVVEVPEWDEREGKEELRRYVDWMIEQLEDPRYRDAQGSENRMLMREDMERWLKPQQLLNQVMKQNKIKVKCRKMTADGQLSSTPTSWESSNHWSGGEKWSKNMALFLGILNYMAEKRQAITGKNRTVILDNPFGKASSEHVLDPVFFIAGQLGFQIIALTALAEGKYVRDYFPVVYSCRLRPVAGSDKQIIGFEKEIRSAHFKDEEPVPFTALGERAEEPLL